MKKILAVVAILACLARPAAALDVLPGGKVRTAQMTGVASPPLVKATQKLVTFGSFAVNPVCAATCPYTGVSFGAADPSRYIIACVGAGSNGGVPGSLNSITIGGVTATLIVTITGSSNIDRVGIYSALVPTGTSGDIVITWNVNPARQGMGFWRATGFDRIAAVASGTDQTAAPAIALASSPGGVVIGCSVADQAGSSDWSPTSVTTDWKQAIGGDGGGKNFTMTGGHGPTVGGTITPSLTITGTILQNVTVAASF